MAYVICKNPMVRIDIMILQKYWPQMVGMIRQSGCTYFKEDWAELPNGHKYVMIRDVKSEHPNQLGTLFKMLNAMETTAQETKDKFYILIKPRKKGKKYVQKDRKEIGTGSESGNAGESGDLQSEGNSEVDGSGFESTIPDPDDLRQLEMLNSEEGVFYIDN